MYNPSHHAIVFMEVLSMNEALKTQLKILKLSDIKPNFSELARFYDLDRRQRLTDYYNENFNAIRPREYTTRTHDSLKKVTPHSCYFSDKLGVSNFLSKYRTGVCYMWKHMVQLKHGKRYLLCSYHK